MLSYTIHMANTAATIVVQGSDVHVSDGVLTVVVPVTRSNVTGATQVVFAAPVQKINRVESAPTT